jgi:hypothetical protein
LALFEVVAKEVLNNKMQAKEDTEIEKWLKSNDLLIVDATETQYATWVTEIRDNRRLPDDYIRALWTSRILPEARHKNLLDYNWFVLTRLGSKKRLVVGDVAVAVAHTEPLSKQRPLRSMHSGPTGLYVPLSSNTGLVISSQHRGSQVIYRTLRSGMITQLNEMQATRAAEVVFSCSSNDWLWIQPQFQKERRYPGEADFTNLIEEVDQEDPS